MNSRSTSLQHRLTRAREELVERILLGVLLIAVVGVPASWSRVLTTGWLPLYGVHLGLGCAAVAVFVFRARLSLRIKMVLILVLFAAVGVVGLLQLGPLGAGAWWLAVCGLLAGVFFSLRVGVAIIAASLVAVMLIGVGFSSGWLSLGIDANAYIRHLTAWVTLLIATILMPLIVFAALRGRDQTIVGLLHEIDEQGETIRHLANFDELTGAANRKCAVEFLQQELNDCSTTEQTAALLFIDLDGFKLINDTWGHDAGDHVLRTLAKRMAQRVQSLAQLGRLGGDEFLVFLGPVTDSAQAVGEAEIILATLNESIAYQGWELGVGASVGISLFPRDARTATALIKAADTAMYAAKAAGKNQICLAS